MKAKFSVKLLVLTMGIIIWLCIIPLANSSHGAFKSCYECMEASEDNYICDWDGKADSKWEGACCAEGTDSTFCRPGGRNTCSPTYKEAQHMYWAYCPLINNTMCGTESADMSLEANHELQSFYND